METMTMTVVAHQPATGGDSTRSHDARHVCHCGKSFIRKEHLRRHQATHGDRAHICPTCRKSFTRNDLLRRHVSLHEASSTPEPRRGRACDACHANKTKCDGGVQCSLCARRKITCTYQHALGSNTRRSVARTSSSSRDQDSVSAGSEGEVGHQQQQLPGVATVPLPQASGSSPSVLMGLNSMSSRRSDPMTSFILLAMMKKLDDPDAPLKDDFIITHEAVPWFQRLLEVYLARFHDAWPVIHGPTFIDHDTPLVVVASVVMIALWLEGDENSMKNVLSLHELIMKRLSIELLIPIPRCPTGVWPTEVYQACVLNIAFSVCCGNVELARKGVLLRGLFVSSMRQVGILVGEYAAYQQQAHYPGNFIPYLQTVRERWKRIVTCAFKLDTYLALVYNQPPCLNKDELDICLPSTFALWNGFGLDIFFKRVPLEPSDRAGYKMSDMLFTSRAPARPILLIEDVQLGLCGLLPSIWRLSQLRRRYVSPLPPGVDTQESLSFQLDMWKSELERLSTLCSQQFFEEKTTEFPFRAYMGDIEDMTQAKTMAFIRIRSLVSDAMILYHVLCLHLYADIQTMHLVTTCLESSSTPARVQKHSGGLHAWTLSPDSRKAVLQAVAVLRAREAIMERNEPQARTIDPIMQIAISASALVIWAWLSYADAPCSCLPDLNHIDLAMYSADLQQGDARLDSWITSGGTAALNGVTFCRCFTPTWMDRFDRAQPERGQNWELAREMAPVLALAGTTP